jgi:hypothetical protein
VTQLKAIVVDSYLANSLSDQTSPYSGESFKIGDQIVQCPKCERWYLVDDWKAYESQCSVHGCTGKGKIGAVQQSAITSKQEPDLNLTIIDTFDNNGLQDNFSDLTAQITITDISSPINTQIVDDGELIVLSEFDIQRHTVVRTPRDHFSSDNNNSRLPATLPFDWDVVSRIFLAVVGGGIALVILFAVISAIF